MNSGQYFTIKDENGNEVEYRILFSLEDQKTNRHYLVYTDTPEGSKDPVRYFAARYNPDDDPIVLSELETLAEYRLVQRMINKANEEQQNQA